MFCSSSVVHAETKADGVGLAKERAPVVSLDPLENDLRDTLRVELDVVDGDDVGVLERTGHPRLAHQLGDGSVRDALRAQGLDRDLTPEPELCRAEHDAHSPLAQRVMHHECAPRSRASAAGGGSDRSAASGWMVAVG